MSARRRPRVLHVIDSLGRGGAERQLLQIASYLAAQGVDQSVLHLFRDDSLASDLRAHGVEVHGLGLRPHTLMLPVALARTLAHASALGPTVIATQLVSSDIVGRLTAGYLGIPAITTWQNTTYSPEAPLMRGARTGLVMRALRRLDQQTSRHAQRFVAVSEAVRTSYVAALGVDVARTTVIPNTVDLRRFAPRHSRRDPPVRLIHVGRHVPQKDVETLLRAVAQLSDATPFTLDLVGAGPQTESLMALAGTLGISKCTAFHGAIADVVPLLQQADVFVFPSRHEGLPLALLEALAAGLPVVASDIRPSREIDPTGSSTMYFPPGDVGALASTLSRLIDAPDLREALGRGAPSLAAPFDANVVGAAYLALIEDLARA